MVLEEQIEEIINYKYWWLICPECVWFAPFGSSYRDQQDDPPHSTHCRSCGTKLLWKGVSHNINSLMYTTKLQDPDYSSECGNGFGGFTSRMALGYIWSQNDIEWWLR